MGTVSTPVTFSGQSTFSSSFQQVLQRAVSIASLPMQELQNSVNDLRSQESDLSNMLGTFSSLQNSVQDIESATAGGVSAISSNSSVVVASAAASTLPGTYSIQVASMGSSTTTISGPGTPPVTDPGSTNISASSTYKLIVNGTPVTITPASDTLDSLATAINNANDGVSATIVNLGSNASPDYRLSLTSNEWGPDTIQLNDGTNDLLTTPQAGADARYSVNGNSTVLTSSSPQVTLAPGLTANLISASPGTQVTVTVAANDNALASALSNFATSYNAAVSALSNERGQAGGALAGDSIIYTLTNTLSKITQYVAGGSGAAQDLSDLGLNLDSAGNLSFNQSQFNNQSATSIQQFLGDVSSGGFLKTASNALTGVADPTTGSIAGELTTMQSEVTNDINKIADDQTRINSIQSSLQLQLSNADAAIAVLQQQTSFYTNLFATENANHNAGIL